MKIGFGNGGYYRIDGNNNARFFKDELENLHQENMTAIELNCQNANMARYLADVDVVMPEFDYVSLHAPVFPYADNPETRYLMRDIKTACKKYNIDNVVVHPDTVHDWSIFDFVPEVPFSIENMDVRKTTHTTVEEIKELVEKYNFKITLDLQHCFEIDTSMQTAKDFQRELKGLIAQYHLSGLHGEYVHYSLFETKQRQIIEAIEYPELPIIIESTYDNHGDHVKELDYVLTVLKS